MENFKKLSQLNLANPNSPMPIPVWISEFVQITKHVATEVHTLPRNPDHWHIYYGLFVNNVTVHVYNSQICAFAED